MSELYSSLLLREGIAHNLLNANNAPREAEMIAESGQMGAVTVATSMAGRGTDTVSYTHLDVYKRQTLKPTS